MDKYDINGSIKNIQSPNQYQNQIIQNKLNLKSVADSGNKKHKKAVQNNRRLNEHGSEQKYKLNTNSNQIDDRELKAEDSINIYQDLSIEDNSVDTQQKQVQMNTLRNLISQMNRVIDSIPANAHESQDSLPAIGPSPSPSLMVNQETNINHNEKIKQILNGSFNKQNLNNKVQSKTNSNTRQQSSKNNMSIAMPVSTIQQTVFNSNNSKNNLTSSISNQNNVPGSKEQSSRYNKKNNLAINNVDSSGEISLLQYTNQAPKMVSTENSYQSIRKHVSHQRLQLPRFDQQIQSTKASGNLVIDAVGISSGNKLSMVGISNNGRQESSAEIEQKKMNKKEHISFSNEMSETIEKSSILQQKNKELLVNSTQQNKKTNQIKSNNYQSRLAISNDNQPNQQIPPSLLNAISYQSRGGVSRLSILGNKQNNQNANQTQNVTSKRQQSSNTNSNNLKNQINQKIDDKKTQKENKNQSLGINQLASNKGILSKISSQGSIIESHRDETSQSKKQANILQNQNSINNNLIVQLNFESTIENQQHPTKVIFDKKIGGRKKAKDELNIKSKASSTIALDIIEQQKSLIQPVTLNQSLSQAQSDALYQKKGSIQMTPAFKMLQSNSNSILNNSKQTKVTKVQSKAENFNESQLVFKEIQISDNIENSKDNLKQKDENIKFEDNDQITPFEPLENEEPKQNEDRKVQKLSIVYQLNENSSSIVELEQLAKNDSLKELSLQVINESPSKLSIEIKKLEKPMLTEKPINSKKQILKKAQQIEDNLLTSISEKGKMELHQSNNIQNQQQKVQQKQQRNQSFSQRGLRLQKTNTNHEHVEKGSIENTQKSEMDDIKKPKIKQTTSGSMIGETLPLNKTRIINDLFDQIFNYDQNNLLSERTQQIQLPSLQQQNGSIMTAPEWTLKNKKMVTRQLNSRSIEIKKSLSITNDVSKNYLNKDTNNIQYPIHEEATSSKLGHTNDSKFKNSDDEESSLKNIEVKNGYQKKGNQQTDGLPSFKNLPLIVRNQASPLSMAKGGTMAQNENSLVQQIFMRNQIQQKYNPQKMQQNGSDEEQNPVTIEEQDKQKLKRQITNPAIQHDLKIRINKQLALQNQTIEQQIPEKYENNIVANNLIEKAQKKKHKKKLEEKEIQIIEKIDQTPQKNVEQTKTLSGEYSDQKCDEELNTSKNSYKSQKISDNGIKMPIIKNQAGKGSKPISLGILKPYLSNQRSPNKNYNDDDYNPLNYKSNNYENFTLVSENLSKLTQQQKKEEKSHNGQYSLQLQNDFDKIEKLSLINANARYELINANQQLIDFQMNRYIKHAKEQKKIKLIQQREASLTNQNIFNQQKSSNVNMQLPNTQNSTILGPGESFELPSITNNSKIERIRSGQDRNNFQNNKLDQNDTNNAAVKQRQGRLERFQNQYKNSNLGQQQYTLPNAPEIKNNYQNCQIPADILDFTTTPGSRVQQLIQNINIQSQKPPKQRLAINVVDFLQNKQSPSLQFQQKKQYKEDYQAIAGSQKSKQIGLSRGSDQANYGNGGINSSLGNSRVNIIDSVPTSKNL